ncbi:type II secretion system protein GspL [Pseudomonas lijiangensis]|uniref:General secretion pathway protein GspL n=1 Tax=Pseudomonas lijiangensis TaxID=2995658 RepID=A0ABX8HXM3_9PSED|nr:MULTISPECIES: type II secretion system protein GspL [Pseudomonas syringae group]MBX8499341.1 general secretion pathway protein GspL [Pseudomonas lijiangensis]MBX8504920.1 general secretion pathway protein GspL [Pseudomonas lijiangensis]MBX8534917.1 general secretion pathway protein GspL [Pseudomonas cichorii]MBX8548515.1 general secretion pathway protein GspL [Pseudomonas cichorii]MBX8554184.1 general secretion pathway protein GspL [Pseudomonas cichorii]
MNSLSARLAPVFALRDRVAQQWRGSLAQRGWQLWLAELQACLPVRVRHWLVQETVEQVYPWPLPSHLPKASADARRILLLSSADVLVQTLQLPSAAARNLSTVVGYELDRFTPFDAGQLYFVARQESRSASFIQVTLVAILRERLDHILAECAAQGLQPDAVDVGSATERMGIDLLPTPLRSNHVRSGHRVQRWLLWTCGALLLGLMLLWLNDRQRLLDEMQASVQAQKAQVAEVQKLRQQLTNTRGAANYLIRRKAAQTPLSALLSELTACLPSDTWIESLEISDSAEISFSGQSAKASALIARAKNCHSLDNAQFQGVIQPDSRTGKDQYSLRAHLHQENADAPSTDKP